MDEFFPDMDMEGAQQAMQRSWNIHMQAFGPILSEAFKGNIEARAALTAALNHISRQNVKRGLELLRALKDHCRCSADLAAWAFFVGLCFEIAGKPELMRRWYLESDRFGHRFALPQLKLARLYHREARFDEAEKFYRKAIACLNESESADKAQLSAAYTNLCSCLTMMHRFDEALDAWQAALSLPGRPGAEACAAILHAARGEKQKSMEYIAALKKTAPESLFSQTMETVALILSGKHAHFSKAPIDRAAAERFWLWFIENRQAVAAGDEAALSHAARLIEKVFPFLNKPLPAPVIKSDGGRINLLFSDSYAVGLHYGYASLLELCPRELEGDWRFEIVHQV